MGSRTRSQTASLTKLLAYIPGITLSGATVFLLGWMTAAGAFSTFEVTANVAVFTLLAGVSAVAITVPLAISVYQRVPRRARSIFRRRLAWALLDRFIGGSSAAIGLLALIWIRTNPTWVYMSGMVILAVVSLMVGVKCWRLGGMDLAAAPQAARTTVRGAKSAMQNR